MRLEKWAHVAEIVSGIAVVITLIFLVLGIRENTNVIRASAYANLSGELNAWSRGVTSDPDSMRVYADYRGSEADRRRLEMTVVALFRTYESAYFLSRYGLIGEAEWERFEGGACFNYAAASAQGIDERLHAVLSDEFMNFVTESCPD